MATIRSSIVRGAVREERELWETALRTGLCTSLESAKNVEKVVNILRKERDSRKTIRAIKWYHGWIGGVMMGRLKGERPQGRPPRDFMPPFPGESVSSVVGRSAPAGMKLVGFCKDCRRWGYEGVRSGRECPIVLTTFDIEDTATPPDFGCVLWEAKNE